MEKINQKIRLLFFFALGLSIGFPAGIVGIVLGAKNDIVAVLVCGIVLTVAGFYVMPILWVRYGEKRRDRTILHMVLDEHIYTVGDLARQTGYTEQVVRDKLKRMLLSRELTGYLLVDDVLELNTNVKQTARTRQTKKCENCGATMGFDGVKFVCEYCGTVTKEKKRKE